MKIGNNCIVGAASVVTKNVPDGYVVAGIPAKIICKIEEYYLKTKERGMFYPTVDMTKEEKKYYLFKHVSEIE